MAHVTSICLDVHAHSVAACFFVPFTGEVTQETFALTPLRSRSRS